MGRIGTAVVLTAAAIIVPCGAWYVAGSRAARQEARQLRDAPRAWGQRLADVLAERMGARLSTIRETESRRPFYHYQPFYHDPTSTCECASVAPSPLAAGPADPLIWTHFEVDAAGALTLPSTQLALFDDACRSWLDDPAQILAQLRPLATTLSGVAADSSAAAAGGWMQEPWTERGDRDVARVGPLSWHTIVVAGEPTLIALRPVQTPAGNRVQGLVISQAAVSDALAGAPFPTRFSYQPTLRPAELQASLPPAGWALVVDTSEALGDAAALAGAAWSRFARLFATSAATAVLAGLIVVGLVWKTERLAQQRARFAASAAHELRTPLAGLRVYGEMLADGMGDPAKAQEYARRMAQEAERLGRVVSNVLGYTRLERGSLGLRLRKGDLAPAVRDCVEQLRPALEAAGALVRLSVQEGLPPVAFDPDAVFHIVQNLLDNAEKYSRGSPDRSVEVTLQRGDAGVRLVVRDHGPGVPDALRRSLFRPFVRTDDPDAPAGLGLGLTLVQRLGRAHRADVACQDAPTGGALFTVTFPVAA